MAEEEESLELTIVEEREELMIDPTSSQLNKNPTLKTSHFLKPSLNPNSLPPPPPKIQSFSISKRPSFYFLCSSIPLEGWQTWVESLETIHEQTWRKAGIFDAIKCSTYHIAKDPYLIFHLIEKWCPETNTFVFPWGEATVTLEDVFILGGFSPLGVPILRKCSLENDVKQVKNKLIESYRKLMKINPFLSHLRWQEHFMGRGNEIEHAGFLALWLARHVFPTKSNFVVTQLVFSMAATLSCGFKYAFGPAVLVSIYRDLTLLKRKMVGYATDCYDGRRLKLLSALHLVQVWAWERFPSLGPVPRMINCGETRLARWKNLKRRFYDNIDNMKLSLDSASDTFRWRPYAICLQNWSLPRFYVDLGTWVDVVSDEDMMVIARFLMVCQLVGLDCTQDYNPHRVALQFGFDQDIPESIDRSGASCKLSGHGYKESIAGLKLYLPPRLHEGDVTYRYSNWLRGRSNPLGEILVGCKRKKRTKTGMKKIAKICDRSNDFVTIDIDGSVKVNPLEQLPLLQVSNDTRMMTCVLNMQIGIDSLEDTSMGGVEENEARKSNVTISDKSNDFSTVEGNVLVNPMEKLPPLQVGNDTSMITCVLNMPIGVDSLEDASLENVTICESSTRSNSSNTNDETVNVAESLRDLVINHRMEYTTSQIRPTTWVLLCSSVPCNESLNSANEVVQVMEVNLNEGNGRGWYEGQNLIEQKVAIEEDSKYLEVGRSRSESFSQCNGSLTRVACEVNTLNPILEEEALFQGRGVNQADIAGYSEVDVGNDVDNPFADLSLEYDLRIYRLERGFSALFAANVQV